MARIHVRTPDARPLLAFAIAALTLVGAAVVPIKAQAAVPPVADLSYKITVLHTP